MIIMEITIIISAIPIANGKFYPHFSFSENMGASYKTIAYSIDNPTSYDTKEEALKRAQAVGLDEARKVYGSGVKVGIKISNE